MSIENETLYKAELLDAEKSRGTDVVPQSRIEDELAGKEIKPQSRIEQLLQDAQLSPHEKAILQAVAQNPENHNGIYRGKDLSDIYTWDEIYEHVHDGSFEDLYLGDYKTVHIVTDLYTEYVGSSFVEGTTYYEMGGTVIARTWTETQDAEPQSGKVYATKQIVEEDVDLMIANFDYYFGLLSPKVDYHHLTFIPRKPFKNSAPVVTNGTSKTGIPYNAAAIHIITLPCYAKSIKAAVNNHIKTISLYLPSAVNVSTPSMCGAGCSGATTGWAATDVELILPTELQLYGTRILSSSFYDIGTEGRKLDIFNFANLETTTLGIALRTYTDTYNGTIARYAAITAQGRLTQGGSANPRDIHPLMIFG